MKQKPIHNCPCATSAEYGKHSNKAGIGRYRVTKYANYFLPCANHEHLYLDNGFDREPAKKAK